MDIDKIKIENVLEGMQEGFWILDKLGNIIYVNSAGARMFGFEKEEKLGKSIFDFIEDASLKARAISYLPRVLAGEQIKDEVDVRSKNGNVVNIRFFAQLIGDREKNTIGLSLFVEDITENKKMSEEIKKGSDFYKNLLDNSLEGVLMLDFTGNIVWANKIAREIYETGTMEETKGLSIMKFVSPEYIPRATANLIKAISGIKPEKTEYLTISKSGKKYWTETLGRIIELKDNGQKVYYMTFRDITQKKNAENNLLESERKYKEIFENSIDGIFRTTVDGSIEKINLAFAKIFGYSSIEEAVLDIKNVKQLYDDVNDRKNILEILSRDGIVLNYVIRGVTKSGGRPWIFFSAKAVKNDKDILTGLQGAVRDITIEKENETKLKEKMEELEKMNKLMINRELKMIEIKKENEELRSKLK